MKMMNINAVMKQFAIGLAVSAAFLAASARADTNITGTTSVTDPVAWGASAGTVTINSGATLAITPTNQGTYNLSNALVFAGGAGSVNLRLNDNDTIFEFSGPISSTASGAQTLALFTGDGGNGDREELTFDSAIPNASGGSALGLQVTFRTQTGSQSYVNLKGNNTFTGPISLVQGGGGPPTGYLSIGGRMYNGGNTTGTGTLGGGNYAGNIALGTSTLLNYDSSAAQTLSGTISGVGALLKSGSGTLTLSGANTYSGDTTVNSGTLVLGSGGALKFVVTDTTNNKVTGGGTATLNGSFTVDTSAVTAISGSWILVNATTKSFGSGFNLAGFSGSAPTFTKTLGAQSWTFSTTTGVLGLTSNAIITAFGIPGSAGVINQVAKTIALTVPYGTNLATLAPTFTLTTGTCNQTSGSPPSPTFATSGTVTYTVTSGSVVSNYAVTVSVTPASSNKDILTFGIGTNAGVINGTNITLTVPVSPGVTSLAPTYTLSTFATASPLSGTTLDFTNPQTYTVTAQDGSTKIYHVTAQTYAAWTYNASLFILTDSSGANLPGTTSVTNFPLLVRLNASNFAFGQAASDGSDIRFSTAAGVSLPYQIEQWDSLNATAAVWVKIPTITGNTRQEIKIYWGKTGATSESNGANVFNSANGYVSVLHMNETVSDVVGSVTPVDTGTTLTTGMIGKARNFVAGVGIDCGESLTTLPAGNVPHSTQAWFRASAVNCEIVDWGLEGGGYNKVQIRLMNPPRIYVDSNGPSVNGVSMLTQGQWYQVVHTYTGTTTNIYINGQLDASAGASMTQSPVSKFWIGGWYNSYSYAGDIDEVRISSVARSADWIKLEYENQKPAQTLVGNPVQTGSTFGVSPTSVTMNEGATTTLTGQAGGAQKVYWILRQNGVDTIVASDQFTYTVNAGRVSGSQSYAIEFKAIYPTGIQTQDVPITVTETLPDPVFTLTGPSTWDGRQTITVTPNISNLATLQAKGVANLTYNWSVAGVAVTKTITAGTPTVPGFLTLTRSQGSGPMTVTLVLSNGGAPVTSTKVITVQEPASDAWVQRTPDPNEKPVTGQFFARNPSTGNGTVYYNGTGAGTTPVYLKVYTTDTGSDVQYGTTLRQTPVGGSYAFSVPIAAGLTTYKVVFGTTTGGTDTVVNTVANLYCGDAYIIEGQSNALATDNGVPIDTNTTPWLRSYGLTLGWGQAINKSSDSELQLGVWGWLLAKRLLADYSIPICIIQGAVGGTRIDQHQPNPAGHALPGSLYSIYANLYNRVVGAKLTHGIRGVFWHQGEQDQGSGGPDGDYDYKFYQQYFVDMSASWKQDFPNIRNYYLFQIWPAACGDTSKNDQLREVQRTLPYMYSNMRAMSTVGIVPGSSCHYVLDGYQRFCDLIGPLVEQDADAYLPATVFSAPNLKKAYYSTTACTEITLVFDQNVAWNTGVPNLIFLDGVSGKVTSGSVTGNVVKLTLTAASTAKAITYLQGIGWDGVQGNLLYGTNGVAALTFADVPLTPSSPTGLVATAGISQVGLTWTASSGASGYNLKRAATTGGPYSLIGTATGTSYTDSTVTNGTTYYYVASAINTAGEGADSAEASATPNSPYAAWAANPAQGLTAGVNDGLMDDPDHDGIPNLLEFTLGGNPMAASRAILPALTHVGTAWSFEYDRSDLSLPPATTQVVEYGSDLTGWTAITIPATSSGSVTITPGSPSDHVKVAIPTPGARTFARLKVTLP